jgi:hypothetical protein
MVSSTKKLEILARLEDLSRFFGRDLGKDEDSRIFSFDVLPKTVLEQREGERKEQSQYSDDSEKKKATESR